MKKKVLAISVLLFLSVLLLNATTLAYFTDKTDTVSNVFTVGKVDIDLTEDEDWSKPEDHVFMPGAAFDKTPTITVADDSQDAYVFAQIKLNNVSDFLTTGMKWAGHTEGVTISPQQLPTLLTYFIEGFDATKWEIVGNGRLENDTITLTAAYKDKLTAGDSVEIFNKVKMPANVTKEDLIKSTTQDQNGNIVDIEYSDFVDSYIEIQAAAIQADGFASYVEAGNALAEQWGMSF